MQFDGTSTCVDVGTGQLAFTNTPFSISMWVNIAAFPAQAGSFLIGKRDSSTMAGWRLGIAGSAISFLVGTGSATTQVSTGNESALMGKWTHVAATYLPGSRIVIYVEGTAAGSASTGVPAAVSDTPSAGTRIGCASDNVNYFQG